MAFIRSCGAAVSSELQELTAVSFETSEQHKDEGAKIMECDFKGVEKIVHFLLDFSPFTKEPFLKNIVADKIASEQVDVNKAIPIGGKTLNDMTGKDANIHTFKKKAIAISLRAQSSLNQQPNYQPFTVF